jgi:hypothetical protein
MKPELHCTNLCDNNHTLITQLINDHFADVAFREDAPPATPATGTAFSIYSGAFGLKSEQLEVHFL